MSSSIQYDLNENNVVINKNGEEITSELVEELGGVEGLFEIFEVRREILGGYTENILNVDFLMTLLAARREDKELRKLPLEWQISMITKQVTEREQKELS